MAILRSGGRGHLASLLAAAVTIFAPASLIAQEKDAPPRPANTLAQHRAAHGFSIDALDFMIRATDLGFILADKGHQIEQAIRARGMDPNSWILTMLRGEKFGQVPAGFPQAENWPPSCPGLASTASGRSTLNPFSENDLALITYWETNKWRPTLKTELQDRLHLDLDPTTIIGPPDDSAIRAGLTLESFEVDPLAGVTQPAGGAPAGTTGGPHAPGGDPRVADGFKDGVKTVSKELAKVWVWACEKVGVDPVPPLDPNEGSGGGGVRGMQDPEKPGRTPTRMPPLWDLVFVMGGTWDHIRVGQPVPVTPVDPEGSTTTKKKLFKPKGPINLTNVNKGNIDWHPDRKVGTSTPHAPEKVEPVWRSKTSPINPLPKGKRVLPRDFGNGVVITPGPQQPDPGPKPETPV